jgi:hypothetical protein
MNMRNLYHYLLAIILYIPATTYAWGDAKQMPAKPLEFMANTGQLTDQYGKPRKDIDAKLDCGGGLTIFVGDGQLHYQWVRVKAKGKTENLKVDGLLAGKCQLPVEYQYCRMDVALLDANTHAEVVMGEEQPYYENHYLPQCPNGAIVHSYSKLTYKNVYPNIDWVLYTKDGGLKHEFVVRPGGDVAKIKLRYTGASSLKLGKDGAFTATTPYGSIGEAAPYSYDPSTGKTINSSYKLEGSVLSYTTGATTDDATLVIDPQLKWATYYGGNNEEEVYDVAADTAGNVYMAGTTRSANNIASAGALQGTLMSIQNMMVAKFDLNGTRQWGTYYGGGTTEDVGGIATDAAGNVYICGTTGSSGLGTAGTQQPAYAGMTDAILLKLNTLGARQWCSYFGMSGNNERATDVSVNYTGDIIYLGLGTDNGANSGTGLATAGAYQSSGIAALAKFTNAGLRVWCTYTNLAINEITEDAGNVYIGGRTIATTGIATVGSHQPALSGTQNAGLMKFNGIGGLLWGTYYGDGFGVSTLESICTDAAGSVYIAGGAATNAFPPTVVTTGAHQTAWGGSLDGFITKFNGNNGTRIWGTLYGGIGIDQINAIAVDDGGHLLVSGSTNGDNAIATTNGYQNSNQLGDADAFWAVFNTNGTQLYGTYYGGVSNDGGAAICYGKGRITVGGNTSSTSGIATTLAHQTTYAGGTGGDGFLAQFAADTAVYISNLQQVAQLCVGDAIQLGYDVSQPFRPGNVFTLQISNAAGSFAAPVTLATAISQVGGNFNFTVPGLPAGSGYRMRILATAPRDTTEDIGFNINIGSYPTNLLANANTPLCTGTNLNLTSSSSAGSASYSWTGPLGFTSNAQSPTISTPPITASGDYIVTANNNGCIRKDTVTVLVGQTPATPTAGSNSPICEGAALNLTSNSITPGVSYSWTGPGGFSSSLQNPTLNPSVQANAGVYTVTATLAHCTATANTTVVINTTTYLGAYASPNDTVCAGTLVTFVTVPINGGQNPTYQWFKNNVAIPGATSITYPTTSYAINDTFYASLTASDVCSSPITLFSNKVGMFVHANTTKPTANISPAAALPGTSVTFTANVTAGGGQNPSYQWQLNGYDVGGATQKIWSTSNLAPYDKVNCMITSSDPCATPARASSDTVEVNFNTSFSNAHSPEQAIKLYPNPNNGCFKIKSTKEAIKSVVVLNSVGQVIYEAEGNEDRELGIALHIAAGVYLLQVETEGGVERLSFTVR